MNEKYQLDLIGRDYCRDRSIASRKEEFNFSFRKWGESAICFGT